MEGACIMAALNEQEAKIRASALPGWQIESGELVKSFQFTDFRAALGFVNRVGEAAEAAQHHPDIDIRYNKVRLSLVTHDAGGLTEKDFDLATKANSMV
jgi:4a-hydroxytetrahydrobiopterin dehydratase